MAPPAVVKQDCVGLKQVVWQSDGSDERLLGTLCIWNYLLLSVCHAAHQQVRQPLSAKFEKCKPVC